MNCKPSICLVPNSTQRFHFHLLLIGFAKRQLDKHNHYRSKHGARKLAYSNSLENSAQRHANYLARLNDGLEHSNSNNGENVAVYYHSRSSPSAEGTTKYW